MVATLTALYDLAISPLTFDFAYAVVQAELERRRRGCARLCLYIRREDDPTRVTYRAPDDADWRLRHVLAPLSQLLEQPADLCIGTRRPTNGEIYSRPHGLHWLSDVAALAEAGQDVQLLTAGAQARASVENAVRDVVQGRRLITITLRETRYGISRNSNMLAWASVSRRLSAEGYAVVVLRDHERVSEALPGDWGTATTLPTAVWNLRWRLALYELAWLNLGVNNGPPFMGVLSPHTRFLIFKMLGETPETSAQHCRRLGLYPGGSFAFLKPHQQLVWDIDEAGVLNDRVFMALADIESGHVHDTQIRPVAECIIAAARRDYRAGRPAAFDLDRVPLGSARRAIAIERATMLLDEGCALEAARALSEAPPGPDRSALATSIAHARPHPEIAKALRPLMIGTETADWKAALQRVIGQPRAAANRAPRALGKLKRLVIRIDGMASPSSVLLRLAEAERERRRRKLDGLHLVVVQGNETWLAAVAFFPTIASFTLHHDACAEGIDKKGYGRGLSSTEALVATVPILARRQLKAWLLVQGIANSDYAIFAPSSKTDAHIWLRAVQAATTRGLTIVYWANLAQIWPLEMLAALLEGASLRVLSEPLAVTLSHILGLGVTPPDHPIAGAL